MSTPLLSCIVGVYNGERYLRETLESIFAQTHRPIEAIVADDGSTDGTAEIARGFREPVRYLYQPNAAPAAARNLGLSAARGEYVALLDADDLWHPEKLERQLARFEARPELGIVFTHIENFWSPDVEAADRPGDLPQRPVPGYAGVTMLARRRLFETVGPLDVSLKHGNDRDWFIRAAEAGVAVEMMPDVLVRRRLHGANRSSAMSESSRAEYLRILKASLDRRRARGGDAAAYPFGSSGDRLD